MTTLFNLPLPDISIKLTERDRMDISPDSVCIEIAGNHGSGDIGKHC